MLLISCWIDCVGELGVGGEIIIASFQQKDRISKRIRKWKQLSEKTMEESVPGYLCTVLLDRLVLYRFYNNYPEL